MRSLDIAALEERTGRLRREFAAALPFPHLVLDDFLRPDAAEALLAEFAAPHDWQHFHHVNEKKLAFNDPARMAPACRAAIADLHAPPFLGFLEAVTGVAGLRADPDLDGGGLQQTRAGGFLNVHHDFLAHATRRTWSRQLNLLLFLNKGWDDRHRGWLEFWDRGVTRCERRIAPLFNRCVLFRTTATSFHGVPAGVSCPPDESRKSLALYYFRDEGRVCPLVPTHYRPRPGDSATRRLLIRLDTALLRAYALLKRYTPLSDAVVSRVLRYF